MEPVPKKSTKTGFYDGAHGVNAFLREIEERQGGMRSLAGARSAPGYYGDTCLADNRLR